MHRMLYPFLGAFRNGLGVSLPALSIVLTIKSVVGALGPFLAMVADSRGRKTGMLLGIVVFTAGAGTVLVWPSFPGFVAAVMLTMLGKCIFDPSVHAFLGDQIAYEQRGRVMAISEFGWSLSFILGVPLAGLLIAKNGWKGPFPVFTILGIILFGFLAISLRKDQLRSGTKILVWQNLGKILSYPPALAGLAMSICFSCANEVFNLVFGVWLADSFGLKITALGAAAAVIGLSELSGESLVAALVDRLGKVRSVSLGLILNSLMALILPLMAHNVTSAVVGLSFFYITFEFTLVSSIPLMSEVFPSARATMIGSNVSAVSLGRAVGALLAAPLYSVGIFANTAASAVFNLLSMAALFWLSRSLGGRK